MANERRIDQNRYISWSAIIIGALVGIGLSFLLNAFALGIGLTAFTTTAAGAATFAIGGFIGMLIGSIVTMFFTGWITGYLASDYCSNRNIGSLYGFSAWCLSLVLVILLATSASQFISNYNQTLSNPAAMMVKTTSNTAAPVVGKTNQDGNTPSQVVVSAAKAPAALGVSLFVTFILFFLGALASCLGGYFGVRPSRK